MRLSLFYTKTRRSMASQDSINAYLLEKAGFISQVAAGVYAYLPMATRSMQKIEQIIREEMNNIGGSEVIFSALQPKSTWEKSGRWEDKNFRQIVYMDPEADMTFGATHEEPMTIVVKQGVQSYRDLPVILYQFQTKFRKELRAKSGLLRGREFRMKDLYSFHPDEKAHHEFYEEAANAYLKAFKRLGLDAYRVKASGGIFGAELSDEFQVLCQTGEDEVLIDHKTKTGFNKEVEDQLKAIEIKKLERVKTIEVGNIFHLGTKYTDAFDLKYLDASGIRQSVWMGSYGIGISRLLGTLAELNNDEHGLKLPRQIAPFEVVVIDLTDSKTGTKIHDQLEKTGREVLLDDRDEMAGTKLVDADLIGYPIRLVYSSKTAQEGKVEIKERNSGKVTLVDLEDVVKHVEQLLS
ncbi:MAG: His/Gly/Thr/Pro-type tRNA ligase C-terminal domain-containing protein [Candidatus Berkelbacteria bacterium]|nr:His/Gly/Thr/Pro-type tRNA ligase C-terminal domain-containing protein [Candidatus Berkelbacteria bacterium]MCR4307726.1 His/Gly/Thr/Pro-type tRNA ligase C-terminal domain-containing protein [Candidatus Berkelbacteria bacterium]